MHMHQVRTTSAIYVNDLKKFVSLEPLILVDRRRPERRNRHHSDVLPCLNSEGYGFYARQHICYSAYMLSSFCLSVRPSDCLSRG